MSAWVDTIMQFRAPRPIKAAKGLVGAWRGETPRLYRICYQTDAGEEGVFLWLDGKEIDPDIIYNSHRVFLEDKQYAPIKHMSTTTERKTWPVVELQDVSLIDGSDPDEIVEIPREFVSRWVPEVDNKDVLG